MTDNIPSSRRHLVTQRWVAWFGVALFSVATCTVLGWWQRELIAKVDRVPAWGWVLLGITLAGGVAMHVARSGAREMLAFYDLRHFWVRPGYWTAIALGVTSATWIVARVDVVAATYQLEESQKKKVYEWTVLLVTHVVVPVVGVAILSWATERLLLGWRLDRRVNRRGPDRPSPFSPRTASMEALRKWIRSDVPVEKQSEDLFGHIDVARRIAGRLMAASESDDEVSQAVVGRLGSGKTSVLELVRMELNLQEFSEARIVDIQMWPYETARAAVTGILDRIVSQLRREVNVIGLRGLSGAYAEAVSMVPGGKTFLAAVARTTESPVDALSSIDDIARVIGKRYVVWIEDLERFAVGVDADEKLGFVRALLHGLHRLPSFTVVTATTDLAHRLDIEKIARYVERVPEPRPELTRAVIAQFVEGLRVEARARHCEIVEKPYAWSATTTDLLYARAMLGDGIHDVPTAVDRLQPTPRALKQALRRCDEVWRSLSGEIDLDEVVAMCLLREVQPRAFALLETYAEILKSPTPDRLPDPVLSLRDELVAVLGPRDSVPVVYIINEVFQRGELSRHRPRLQGIGSRTAHADYWQRFNSIPQLAGERTDQGVLRAIASRQQERIVNMLEDEYGGQAAVYFAECFSCDLAESLLMPLLQRNVDREWRGNGVRGGPRGLVPLWRVIERVSKDQEGLAVKLEAAIDLCARRNLGLLVLVEMYFCGESSRSIWTTELRIRLQRRARNALLHNCSSPEALVDALRGHHRFVLMQVIWGIHGVLDHAHQQIDREPFEGWPSFAEIVVRALELDPDLMVPHLASIVFSEERERGDEVGNRIAYEPRMAEARFGDSERIAAAIRRARPESSLIQAMQAALPTAVSVGETAVGADEGGSTLAPQVSGTDEAMEPSALGTLGEGDES